MHYEKENSLIRLRSLCCYLLLVQVKGKSPPKRSKKDILCLCRLCLEKRKDSCPQTLGQSFRSFCPSSSDHTVFQLRSWHFARKWRTKRSFLKCCGPAWHLVLKMRSSETMAITHQEITNAIPDVLVSPPCSDSDSRGNRGVNAASAAAQNANEI